MSEKVIRIGGGSGFWGDTAEGPRQLVEQGDIQYLALDYLAEVTMSIMARVRSKKPELGYATDFVSELIRPLARQLQERGVKVVCNAGGVNPLECCRAIERELAAQRVNLRVAAVLGDDAMGNLGHLREMDVREIATGQPIPELITASAYLGAFPIARALAEGADIVVTGRCADSALALGPLIHEFGWTATDFDALAGGSLAGHVIECGPQSTGGFFTDWRDVPQWENIGFPIAECRRDGSFTVTKPSGTGGLVSFATVAEQITYETGDPRNYILPDVVCDLADVSVREVGPHRVEVTGVRGKPPTTTYKVSGTWQDGYRALATLLVKGRQAVPKARAVAEAVLQRTSRIFAREGLADYSETSVEVLGAEDSYSDNPDVGTRREVILKIAVRHPQARALEYFSKEIFPTSTSTVQGVAGVFGGRPKVQPMVRLFSFLAPKEMHGCTVHIGEQVIEMPAAFAAARAPGVPAQADVSPEPVQSTGGPTACVPLAAIAYARSGDKGDISNVSVIARRAEFLDVIARQVTIDTVKAHMAKLVHGNVERFDWPGLHGFNFLLHEALGGGGVASLRYDPQGKAHGQMLLDLPVHVPREWVDRGLVAMDA
ncbi:MAG: acyclic terpene utilization AtuA family protein [Pseudomonadota bacterium]